MVSVTGCYDHIYKVVLVGDASVGKTHLLSRYIKGELPPQVTATVGVEFATRLVQLAFGGTAKVQIWDTAGQERHRAITSNHYRRAVGAVLVYDITRRATFDNCMKWLEELRQLAEPDMVIMLVGNKLDLAEVDSGARKVQYEEAADFARRRGFLFAEASAVSTKNVEHLFRTLIEEIYHESTKGKYQDGGKPLTKPVAIVSEGEGSESMVCGQTCY